MGNMFSTPQSAQELLESTDKLLYFHANDADKETLAQCRGKAMIFEIDVAITSDTSFVHAIAGIPFIGHPSAFYEMPGREFPESNVSLEEFKQFLLEPENKSIKVLLDIKTMHVLPHIVKFAQEIGKDRCFAHAFILDWNQGQQPSNIETEPHWVEEDISLEALDKELQAAGGIPLIANCRGFCNEHVEVHEIIPKMIEDAKRHKSVAALGLYYPESADKPLLKFLRSFNDAGFKAWINANTDLERYKDIRWVGMCDSMEQSLLPV